MEIVCPNCGQVCETEEEPTIGQHVLCPFCNEKFTYGDSTSTARSHNVGRPMDVKCPGCGTEYEVNASEVGQEVKCEVCGRKFVVGAKDCPVFSNLATHSDINDVTADNVAMTTSETAIAVKIPRPEQIKQTTTIDYKGNRRYFSDDQLKRANMRGCLPVLAKQDVFPGTRSIGVKINPNKKKFSPKPKKKFCQECGNELHPRAVICPKCGCQVPNVKQPTSWSSIDPSYVSDHMLGAIISMFLFLPMGLVAMHYVLQSRQKQKDGDCSGAEDDSRTAGSIVKWTTGIAVVGFVFWLIWGFCVGRAIQKEMKATDDYIRNATREAERLSREAERIMRSVDYYY